MRAIEEFLVSRLNYFCGKGSGYTANFLPTFIYLQCDKDTGYGTITSSVKGVKLIPGSVILTPSDHQKCTP